VDDGKHDDLWDEDEEYAKLTIPQKKPSKQSNNSREEVKYENSDEEYEEMLKKRQKEEKNKVAPKKSIHKVQEDEGVHLHQGSTPKKYVPKNLQEEQPRYPPKKSFDSRPEKEKPIATAYSDMTPQEMAEEYEELSKQLDKLHLDGEDVQASLVYRNLRQLKGTMEHEKKLAQAFNENYIPSTPDRIKSLIEFMQTELDNTGMRTKEIVTRKTLENHIKLLRKQLKSTPVDDETVEDLLVAQARKKVEKVDTSQVKQDVKPTSRKVPSDEEITQLEWREFCTSKTDCEKTCREGIHPCRYNLKCKVSFQDNPQHFVHYAHDCSFDTKCRKLDDMKHCQLYNHTCSFGAKCNKSKDKVHANHYNHPCMFGPDCHNKTGFHKFLFSHPSDRRGSTGSTPTPGTPTTSLTPDPLLKKQNYTFATKSSLKPHATSWKQSSGFEMQRNGEQWKFVGLVMKDKCNLDPSKVLVMKDTGKGFTGGYIQEMHTKDVVIPKSFSQPWDHKDIMVYHQSSVCKIIQTVLSKSDRSHGKSSLDIMKHIHANGIPVFVVGGLVRDAIQGSQNPKDIDIGFGCSANEVATLIDSFLNKKMVTVGPRGLVDFKTVELEGKAINGWNNDINTVTGKVPPSIGTSLWAENICRDFTCNAIWYDPINDILIDPTGTGIVDAINKELRIPVGTPHWDNWVIGNPTKLLRYWKFIAKGYKPCDTATRDFIIKNATAGKLSKSDCSMQYKHQTDQSGFKSAVIKDLGQKFWDDNFK
jgi:hypothetical protein